MALWQIFRCLTTFLYCSFIGKTKNQNLKAPFLQKKIYRISETINFIDKFQITADFVEKWSRKLMAKIHYFLNFSSRKCPKVQKVVDFHHRFSRPFLNKIGWNLKFVDEINCFRDPVIIFEIGEKKSEFHSETKGWKILILDNFIDFQKS
jgi:hypothetical protein